MLLLDTVYFNLPPVPRFSEKVCKPTNKELKA